MVLTGDSLLVGDVGRPDFGGGDAAAQFDSLARLLRLPDWVAVFPGHFEGPCGKGICGRPSTTVGFESLRAGQFLRQRGFADVASVTGGTQAWRAAGKPLARGEVPAEPPRVVESEWAHAGAHSYVI